MKLYTKGSRVTQSSYGSGTVTSSDEKYTVIEFDEHGRRVFLTEVVTLAKSDQPAPNKPAKEKRRKAAVAATKDGTAPAAKAPAAAKSTKAAAAKPAATKTAKRA